MNPIATIKMYPTSICITYVSGSGKRAHLAQVIDFGIMYKV